METILYFYDMGRGSQTMPLKLERSRQERYFLVRVGFATAYMDWLDAVCQGACAKGAEQGGLRERLTAKGRGRRKMREELHGEMQKLARIVCPLVDSPNECSYVFAENLASRAFTGLWQQYCSFVELADGDYAKSPWVEEMLSLATHEHYVILGSARDLPGPLWQRAAKIKSLRWFLPERQFGSGLQDFVEELSLEYGLVTDLRLLESREEYRKASLAGAAPVNVLDFSGEENLKLSGLAGGSRLFDMCCLSGKRRLVEERNLPVCYCSMKKLWKEWQRSPAALDTTHKNGYTILVNRGIMQIPEGGKDRRTEK